MKREKVSKKDVFALVAVYLGLLTLVLLLPERSSVANTSALIAYALISFVLVGRFK